MSPGSAAGPQGAVVSLSPMAVSGFVGVLVTSLNCLPIGNTDGGRVATALFGRQAGSVITAFTLLCMFLLGLLGNDVALYYAAVAAVTQRDQEVPMMEEVEGVDDARALLSIIGEDASPRR